MTDTITITGVVATAPRNVTTSSGLSITNFRLASTQRRFDAAKNAWVDGETNWFAVSTFRQLAANTFASVQLGQHVVVTGRLKIRPWQSGEKSGINVEIDADAVGHDLSWGFVTYTKGTAPIPVDSTPDDAFPSGDSSGDGELVTAGASAGSSGSGSEAWAAAPLGEDSTPF